jgi:hypothetical protein
MKIAHEAPLSLMKYVQQVTDYDYALASLFEKLDGYYEYFVQAKKDGRMILLDNGVFEEGVAMSANIYAEWIKKLQPDEYIVPDILGDAQATKESFTNWCVNYNHLPGKMIGVVHGKTIEEFVECYEFMSQFADKIAINFAQPFYQDLYPYTKGKTVEIRQVEGRVWIILYLYALGIWNRNKSHHLLGASLPDEFFMYQLKNLAMIDVSKNIETMDTSNPVVYAITQGRYPKEIQSVNTKESTKLKDLITTPYSDKLLVDVITNITQFKIQNNI